MKVACHIWHATKIKKIQVELSEKILIKFGLFCVDSFIYILIAGGRGFAFIIFPPCTHLNTFFAQGM
jgi:hypothetical protein